MKFFKAPALLLAAAVLFLPPPACSSPHLARAEVLMERGIYLEAIREIELHLEISPDDFRAGLMLTRAYLKTENYPLAAEEALRLEKIRPDDPELLELKTEALAKLEERLTGNISRLRAALALDPADTETRIMLAEALADAAEYEEAVSHYNIIIEGSPDNEGIILRYARFLAEIGNINSSESVYRKYLQMKDTVLVRVELAQMLTWDGRYPGAIAELEVILQREPDNLEARMMMADINRWTVNFDEAEKIYLDILADNPGYGPAEKGLEALDYARARMEDVVMPTIEELQELLTEDPEDYDSMLMLARLLARAGRYSEARERYAQYLRHHPDDIMVRIAYAVTLSSLGDLSSAVDEYRKYLRRRPDDILIRFELARRLKWMGDLTSTERELNAILNLDPDNVEVYWELGSIAMSAGHMDKAVEYYRKILEIEPSHRAAGNMINIILTSPRYLITRYREALEESPGDLALRMLLARMFIEAGRYYEAKVELAVILDISPGYPEAGILYRRAEAILQRQLIEDIAGLREAVRRDPSDMKSQLELARLLQAQGRSAESLIRYELVIAKSPDDHEIRREYAEALSWTPGRFADAVREYERLVMLEPDNAGLRMEYVSILKWESGMWFEAEEAIRYAITQDPSDLDLRIQLADILVLRERYAEAMAVYRFVLTLEPGNQKAMAGISNIRELMSPRLNVFLSRAQDSENYFESNLGASYSFYFNEEIRITPSITRSTFREDIPVDEDPEDAPGGGVRKVRNWAYLTRLGVMGETAVDARTNVSAWLGYGIYRAHKNSFSYGARGDYRANPQNRLALQYSRYDAITDVKTVRSLIENVEIDNITMEWEYNPSFKARHSDFFDKMSFSAYASYAMYSDANRHNAFNFMGFYPLNSDPRIELGLGYRYLRFLRDSRHYWSPANHTGPAGVVRMEGSWRDDWTYGGEVSLSFIQSTSSTQTGLSFQVFRNFTPDFTAGLVLTHSEVPREEEASYQSSSMYLEFNYKF